MTIMSFSSFGYEGALIKVEAYLRKGLPVIDIVGLPGSAVKEARERMKAAIGSSNIPFPKERILINLSPADQKKEGSGFDLPIALAVLQGKQTLETPVMVIGELELSGKVRPVCGVLGALLAGAAAGISYFIVPKENEREAAIQTGVHIFGAATLQEAFTTLLRIEHAVQEHKEASLLCQSSAHKPTQDDTHCDVPVCWSSPTAADAAACTSSGGMFEDVIGQAQLVRALHIAAAGGHSVLAYGPPGCGKTISMQRFSSLLPDLEAWVAEEVTRIYSIAGLLPAGAAHDVRIKRPPFRMPHPNASLEGMIGGAGKCMPGEISLAHGGTLFLDEAVQFKQSVLQTLRAPMETGTVTVSRAGRQSTFPARFQLLMALNTCPCGNLGAEGKICTCMPFSVEQYWKKMTAPLIDRMDLRIPVFPLGKIAKKEQYNTEHLRKGIASALNIQKQRYRIYARKQYPQENRLLFKNAQLQPAAVEYCCRSTTAAQQEFSRLAKDKQLSGRGCHALLKIARTIADLECVDSIAAVHIEEAASLREWKPFLPDFLQ